MLPKPLNTEPGNASRITIRQNKHLFPLSSTSRIPPPCPRFRFLAPLARASEGHRALQGYLAPAVQTWPLRQTRNIRRRVEDVRMTANRLGRRMLRVEKCQKTGTS